MLDKPITVVKVAVKRYDDFKALKKINLSFSDNEFFTFLVPSGYRKTTSLRMIAGFEKPHGDTLQLF